MKKKIIALVAIVALIAIVAVCLTACNADSIAKKLDKKDYTVVSGTAEEVAESEFGRLIGLSAEGMDVQWLVLGVKGNIADFLTGEVDYVMVYKFNDADDAKKATEADEAPEGVSVKRIGKIVYIGTEQGVKDAM